VNARDLLDLVWIIPLLPLAGAVLLLLFGKRIGEPWAGWIGTSMMGGSFLWTVVTFLALRNVEPRSHVRNLFTWFISGGFQVKMGFLVDPLSVTMLLFVTGVGTLITLYSIGYMHGDSRFSRFFAYMNLFAASMIILVLGSSFLVTFLGWEGVGLCSYLLISFWFERNSAAVAGKKAFVTNRVGDFGFMLAMFLIFAHLGSLDYAVALPGAHTLSTGTATAIALLLFLGAVGKSAQLPLHIWLPDAMEGPTPVSAMLHAATMVTAGVYLVIRAHPFFQHGAAAAQVVSWVGIITALFAATIAMVNNDIKRVLAYSTISQLGYMFMAAGVGAYGAAMFHMVTHAFFKALLFLGAGSVMHGLHDEQDMRRMGNLRRYMPITAGTFIIAWLAIAGIIPFAGFWSKDSILAAAWFHHSYGLWAVGAVTAVLTAFYMSRQVWLVFFGNERWEPLEVSTAGSPAADTVGAAQHPTSGDEPVNVVSHVDEPASVAVAAHDAHGGTPHESPPLMTGPLVVLAACSIFGGLLELPFKSIQFMTKWLEPVFPGVHAPEPTSFWAGFALSTVALVLAIGGIMWAVSWYRLGLPSYDADPVVERLGPMYPLFAHAWYIDEGVAATVDGPVRSFAGWLSRTFDAGIIDGAVNGVGKLFRDGGQGLRRVQSGLVRVYAVGIALGAAALLLFMLVRTG
jgi:NADH-quinone oxidoreductase subunit L